MSGEVGTTLLEPMVTQLVARKGRVRSYWRAGAWRGEEMIWMMDIEGVSATDCTIRRVYVVIHWPLVSLDMPLNAVAITLSVTDKQIL